MYDYTHYRLREYVDKEMGDIPVSFPKLGQGGLGIRLGRQAIPRFETILVHSSIAIVGNNYNV